MRPAAHSLSFASPKESKQRKGDPAVCDPSLRYGQPAVRGRGVRCETPYAAAQLRSDSRSEPVHEAGVSCSTPATPSPVLLGAYRRAGGRFGSSLRSTQSQYRRALAPCPGPSEAMARVGRLGSLLPVPRSGAQAGRMRVGARMPRALTRRGCPNGAAPQRSEFHGGPVCASIAGFPVAQAQGTRAAGSPFLAYFLSAKRKKVTRPPGRDPAPESNRTAEIKNNSY